MSLTWSLIGVPVGGLTGVLIVGLTGGLIVHPTEIDRIGSRSSKSVKADPSKNKVNPSIRIEKSRPDRKRWKRHLRILNHLMVVRKRSLIINAGEGVATQTASKCSN